MLGDGSQEGRQVDVMGDLHRDCKVALSERTSAYRELDEAHRALERRFAGLLAEVEQLRAEREATEVQRGLIEMGSLLGDVPGCETQYLTVTNPDGTQHRVTPEQVLFLWEAYQNLQTFTEMMVGVGEKALTSVRERAASISDHHQAIDPPSGEPELVTR